MLLLGIILFGMLIGAAAQLIVGRSAKGVDWGLALAAGIVGSFIGGLLISLRSPRGVLRTRCPSARRAPRRCGRPSLEVWR
jgi:uncharacterized membrane protein YeaQ/YmgE (transglycosylase-associated protein family)